MFWYSKQTIRIQRGNETSTSNGVRQGGILLPTLFSIYMDDLSLILSDSEIGCYLFLFIYLYTIYITHCSQINML